MGAGQLQLADATARCLPPEAPPWEVSVERRRFEALGEESLGLIGKLLRLHQAEPPAVIGGDRASIGAEQRSERLADRDSRGIPECNLERRKRTAVKAS